MAHADRKKALLKKHGLAGTNKPKKTPAIEAKPKAEEPVVTEKPEGEVKQQAREALDDSHGWCKWSVWWRIKT